MPPKAWGPKERGVNCFTRTHIAATENLHWEIQLIDYNLLLGRDYIYRMRAIVSSLFRVMCFPHEGRTVKIVDQLSFPGSHFTYSHLPFLNGLISTRNASTSNPSSWWRQVTRARDWSLGGMHPPFQNRVFPRYRKSTFIPSTPWMPWNLGGMQTYNKQISPWFKLV